MKVERIVCDSCENAAIDTFSLFKKRKPDEAESSENGYYYFDLCAACCSELLKNMLVRSEFEEKFAEIIKTQNINARVG